jgi:hypothetical protein
MPRVLTKAELFLEGKVEQLEIESISEAHIYLEFVRQLKDLNTKKFIRQTQDIHKKLESLQMVHDHRARYAAS